MTWVSEWVINGVPNRRDLKQEIYALVPNMASRWQATGPCHSSVIWRLRVGGVCIWKKIQEEKKRSGWTISGHLSTLQQGVIFKRVENSLPLFLQIWSLQQIPHNNSAFSSSAFDFLCNQIPQWQLHNDVFFNIFKLLRLWHWCSFTISSLYLFTALRLDLFFFYPPLCLSLAPPLIKWYWYIPLSVKIWLRPT